MPLISCPACSNSVSSAALTCPKCGHPLQAQSASNATQMVLVQRGFEFKSKISLFGLPLFHLASGFDPATGKKRIAKGVIAVGDVAIGIFALGGLSIGGLAIGGVAFGVFALGGLAIAALLAVGGAALGYYAFGGGAFGAHTVSALSQDPKALELLKDLLGIDMHAGLLRHLKP